MVDMWEVEFTRDAKGAWASVARWVFRGLHISSRSKCLCTTGSCKRGVFLSLGQPTVA